MCPPVGHADTTAHDLAFAMALSTSAVVSIFRQSKEALSEALPPWTRTVRSRPRCQAALRSSPHVAEFGGEHDLLALALDGAADQRLVAADPVHVGGVEKRDPEIEGDADGCTMGDVGASD